MPILIQQMQTHGGNINGKQLLGGFCALEPQNKIYLVFSDQCWRKCQGWSMHLLILQRCPKLLTFCTLIRKATQNSSHSIVGNSRHLILGKDLNL